MKISISNATDIQHLTEVHSLPLATSIPKLCIHLANIANDESLQSIQIQIKLDLLPVSYITVPAMFAKQIANRLGYPVAQSFIRSDYLIVHAGTQHRSITFRAKAITALRKYGIFKVFRPAIPQSYRRRPSMFSSILKAELDEKVQTYRRGDKQVWAFALNAKE